MHSMRSLLKTLTILLLVALMPLRAMAAVTIGFCPSGHEDMAVAAHAGNGHAAGTHAHGTQGAASQSAELWCNICAEHCSSAAFAPSVDGAMTVRPVGNHRTQFAGRFAPAPVPDPLDRPPLA